MNPQPHDVTEFSDPPSRFARILFLIVACFGFLLLSAAQANALDSAVADSVDTDEEVVEEEVAETVPAPEESETVAEVEEITTAGTKPVAKVEETTETATETAAEVEQTTRAGTETVAEETTPETVVATTGTAVDTAVEETAAKAVTTTETLVEPVAEEATNTAAETTELVTEQVAPLADPVADTAEELITETGLADAAQQIPVAVSDAVAAAEPIASDAERNESASAPAIPITASEPEPRFDPGPAWSPLSTGDQSLSTHVVSERPVTITPAVHTEVPGPPIGEIPADFDPPGAPQPDLLRTAWGPLGRAGPPPDAAQSIVFLSAVLLLIGLVRPRLADWLRLQPLIRRDDGLKLAIELPG